MPSSRDTICNSSRQAVLAKPNVSSINSQGGRWAQRGATRQKPQSLQDLPPDEELQSSRMLRTGGHEESREDPVPLSGNLKNWRDYFSEDEMQSAYHNVAIGIDPNDAEARDPSAASDEDPSEDNLGKEELQDFYESLPTQAVNLVVASTVNRYRKCR